MLDYQLIDFGGGRKLESLSGYIIDRPSPAASQSTPALPKLWTVPDARFDEPSRQWVFNRPWPTTVYLDGGAFKLPLRATPFGHIGAFPEQRSNWRWLIEAATKMVQRVATTADHDHPVQALNLFAHTGGSTLALASAGAVVVHLDAAKPNVVAAREAAQVSGLDQAPIRYIIDDAVQFSAREVRRRRRYDIIVLDPPAYGHAPDGRAWRMQRDLWPLLDSLAELMNVERGAVLVTGHSEGLDRVAVTDYLRQLTVRQAIKRHIHWDGGRSQLSDRSGRQLDAGFYVRAQW